MELELVVQPVSELRQEHRVDLASKAAVAVAGQVALSLAQEDYMVEVEVEVVLQQMPPVVPTAQ